MEIMTGYPLPLGVSVKNDRVNFSVAVESGKKCKLCIYKRENETPEFVIELPESEAIGEVRFVALLKSKMKGMEYNYLIEDEYILDPYVKAITSQRTHGKVLIEEYDWEGDKPLHIPYHKVIAYNMHVRGFTKHKSSKVKKKGTFQGMIEKIPYLKDLGINQIVCMPVYDFKESVRYKNYWGYGEAFCFAIKHAYAAGNNPEKELKDMVKAYHKNGIEVVLNLPFTWETPKQLIEECLRYYVMEYHIDGFVLNPYVAPMEGIYSDPILKKTKILKNRDDFQNIMRCFLKGDKEMVQSVMWWLKQLTKESGSYNYITNHTGFTLADLVSYDEKHNEENGENNQDGPDENYSWNCGVEGPTHKKSVLALRNRQMRNAMFLMLMSQGIPCILAGDEFKNTQNGNNNVYCQDNETAWLDWRDLEKNKTFYEYVKCLIKLRKSHSVFGSEKPLSGTDRISCGVPDISYHGENAWQIPNQKTSRQLGVYYHGEDGTDCFIAYNMHCKKHKFAFPMLGKNKEWHCVFSTADEGVMTQERVLENQKETIIEGRTIVMFVGR